MSISAQGQVCIENLTAVLHYSVFPQEDKYSPLREETLTVISHCCLQDGLGAEQEMTHNKNPGSNMWPVLDSSSFKKDAGNFTT